MRLAGRFAVVFVCAVLAASQCWHMLPALGAPPPEPGATVVDAAPPTPEPGGSSPESTAGAFGAAIALLALVVAVAGMGRLSDAPDRGASGPGKDGRTTL